VGAAQLRNRLPLGGTAFLNGSFLLFGGSSLLQSDPAGAVALMPSRIWPRRF